MKPGKLTTGAQLVTHTNEVDHQRLRFVLYPYAANRLTTLIRKQNHGLVARTSVHPGGEGVEGDGRKEG